VQNLRRLNLLLTLILSVWLLGVRPVDALTVVTWNLEWFPGRFPNAGNQAKQEQMESAQKALKEIKPDILLVQELADWSSFQQLVGATSGLVVHAVSAFRDTTGVTRQQVAIASCLPANSTWSENFKRGWAEPPRGFAFAALTLPDGELLFVYSLHLKSNLVNSRSDEQHNIAKREDAAEQVLAHVNDMIKLYNGYKIRGVIVGGDFNTNSDDDQFASERTLHLFESSDFWNCWNTVPRLARLSWKGSKRFQPTTFDYLFCKNLKQPRASLWRSSGNASDHYPVLLHLDLP
jgi:endonuclease/exonuclease/phosphatase family metal-dependent hydrolase